VQDLHSLHKFEHPPFWNGFSYSIKNYVVEVTIMTSLLYFINLSIGSEADREADGLTDRMAISLAYSFTLGRKVG
jgi:hypothetical protein